MKNKQTIKQKLKLNLQNESGRDYSHKTFKLHRWIILEFFKTSVSVKNWNQRGYGTVCVKIICVCMSVCQPVCVGVLSVGVSVRLCVCACIFEKEMVKHAASEAMGV